MHWGVGHSGCKLLVFVLFWASATAGGQEKLPKFVGPQGEISSSEGAWENWRVEEGILARRVVELAPAAEASPALSVRLVPDEFHAKEGNAAILYLQAMGFLEQSPARKAKEEFEARNRKLALDQGISNWPPHTWREMRPEEIPLEEVREYLVYTSFQARYLAEAVKRKECSFDRYVRDVENPYMYLLPDIQAMRELARTQSLRFLVAIAEDRVEDALAIFGQQLAMGGHLSGEPFLVSNLVGIACAGIGWHDAFYLCEHPDAPNIYWAIATLPKPLVEMESSLAFEREFLFEQFKMLREVDETPRSNLYWKRFVKRFSKAMEGLEDETDELLKYGEAGIAVTIASGIPGARAFLMESESMSEEALDELPNTQVFFLAVRRYYELVRDDVFKIAYLAPWERVERKRVANELLEAGIKKYGAIAYPSGFLLPAINAALSAQTRLQHNLALLQTVESIRNHLAIHGGQLPASLDELELPAPRNPVTGEDFEYSLHSEGATLDGSQFPGYRVQLELRTK